VAQVGGRAQGKRGITWRGVCNLALRLPGVVEGTSYGTPALHVGKRFLARLKEDGETMAIRIDFADRDVLLELDPETFYLTDHYRPYPAVLVRLKHIPVGLLRQVVEQAWRFQAPRGLAAHRVPRKRERPPGASGKQASVRGRRPRGSER
jgi:hypothetical protein